MWDLPGPGIKPLSPALAGGFLTTSLRHQGSPLCVLLTGLHHSLSIFLLSSMTRYSRLIFYFPYPSLGIIYFPKELWFCSGEECLEAKIWALGVLFVLMVSLPQGLLSGQNCEIYVCIYLYINNRYRYMCIYVHAYTWACLVQAAWFLTPQARLPPCMNTLLILLDLPYFSFH